MTALIDIISPTFLGESCIKVSVDPSCEPLMAFRPVMVDFDYAGAAPEGIALPLELIVQPALSAAADAGGYHRKVFNRHPPTSYTFAVPSAGDYLVLIREVAHNQWQGRLVITVGGDRLSTGITRERR